MPKVKIFREQNGFELWFTDEAGVPFKARSISSSPHELNVHLAELGVFGDDRKKAFVDWVPPSSKRLVVV